MHVLLLQDANSFWRHMAHDLLGPAASRQGVPDRFAAFQEAPSLASFLLALEWAERPEWYIFDEAALVSNAVSASLIALLALPNMHRHARHMWCVRPIYRLPSSPCYIAQLQVVACIQDWLACFDVALLHAL